MGDLGQLMIEYVCNLWEQNTSVKLQAPKSMQS